MTENEKFCLNGAITAAEAKNLNPLVLSFVGDSVQALYIRSKLAVSCGGKSGRLHILASNIVNAAAQAQAFLSVKDKLNGDELEIFRRARNSKSQSCAKNAKITDYRKASGLEAVLGYLYLTGSCERLNEILQLICSPEAVKAHNIENTL